MYVWDGNLEGKELGGHRVDFSGLSFPLQFSCVKIYEPGKETNMRC